MTLQCRLSALTVMLTLTASVCADIDVFSNGSDGSLVVGSGTVTIDLGGAVTGNWDDLSSQPGSGVFDPNMWAVVFHYTTVDIQSGATVNFTNHSSGAPVVWLVQGSVNIAGIVNLNGARGHHPYENRTYAEPGPGGFRGGRGSDSSTVASAGFGPGGASPPAGSNNGYGAGGGHASAGQDSSLYYQGSSSIAQGGVAYGNPLTLPLIGGSGASGGNQGSWGSGGGAGGGAILIASNTTVTVTGTVTAVGGNHGEGDPGSQWNKGAGGAGAGGAIRIIADAVTGAGSLTAVAGTRAYATFGGGQFYSGAGSSGRIRVEANSITLSNPGTPTFTVGLPGLPVKIWPDALAPVIRVISLNGHPVSISPKRGLNFPNQEVFMSEAATVPLVIQAYNVPAAATLNVRIIRKSGSDSQYSATLVDEPAGLWQADVQIPSEVSAIQVRAVLP